MDAFISSLFSSIAQSYDVMNDLMSMGCHAWWRQHAISRIPWKKLPLSLRYMDMACGTGDMAQAFLATAAAQGYTVKAFLVDPVGAMLSQGQEKWRKNHALGATHTPEIFSQPEEEATWLQGWAHSTPFPQDFFHVYTLAFGLRNISCGRKALEEAWRILKPGGILVCLEFSLEEEATLRNALMKRYIHDVIPWLGKIYSPHPHAYSYLAQSIQNFPSPQQLKQNMEEAGFSLYLQESLGLGAVSLYIGEKPS